MPCRNKPPSTRKSIARWLGWLLGFALWFSAHAAPAAIPEAWQPIAQAVSLWGEKNHPDEPVLSLADINERVQPSPCDAELLVDAPFRQSTNLRVRCTSPQWQLFVLTTHQGKAPSLSPAPSNSGTAASASATTKTTTTATTTVPAIEGRWVVPQVHLTRGTRLTADMLKEVPADSKVAGNNTLDAIEQAVGAELVRDIAAGKPLRRHDVRAAVLIKRGAMVKLSVGSGNGFQISVRVLAEESARMGEQIRLKNPESGRIITGKVIGLNEAVGL
jgi:flagella basal body P-ring formation protein FlgA